MFAATISEPPLVALSSNFSSQISQTNKLHRPYCFLPQFFLQENHQRQKPAFLPYCVTSQGASADDNIPQEDSQLNEHSGDMKEKVAKLGLAAVLAYGLFDGVTYTSFFVLAFLGYEKSTGKNPAANLQALLGIVILMWTGNNVTRPFRVAGAAALAPVIDKGLHRIQKYFNFPNLVYAFALVVSMVAGTCFTIIGLLTLSR